MLGEGLWTHGALTLRGLDAPYYSLLTPALVGAPLRLLDLAEAVQWARLLQSLAMSLVAVPTYLWARRLATPGWALAAATITLAAPAFHYAGFLMTEPLTFLVVTVALLALARALEEPSTWRYGVFVAWTTAAAAVRLQALVLLPAFVLAACSTRSPRATGGASARSPDSASRRRRWSSSSPWSRSRRAASLSRRSIFGAYTPVGESAPVSGEGLGEILWHAFDVGVIGLGLPVLAFAALAARVFSRRDPDPPLRAFVSTSLGYAALLVVQAGLFSSVYVGAVAERYLVTLVPLLAIALCAWISRDAPRERRVVVPAWIALITLAALVPLDQLLTPGAIVNTFTPAPLGELGSEALQRLALVAAATAAGALVVFLPPRRAWVCAAVVGVGLALVSAETARLIRTPRRTRTGQRWAPRLRAGSTTAGIDDATLLVNGDRIWTSIARTVFWNRAIREVVGVAPAEVPFPPDTPAASVGEDGVLRTEDGELPSTAAWSSPRTRSPLQASRCWAGHRATATFPASPPGAWSRRAGSSSVVSASCRTATSCTTRGSRSTVPSRDARRDDPREER